MRVVTVSTGMPREVTWHDQVVTTGIFKYPVDGRVAVRTLNLDGDGQADLSVHGGKYKAVYCYPIEHYDYWTSELGRSLPPAAFGENLTTEGLNEDTVHLGDRFAIGSAVFVVTQPRMPCYKLGIRFDSDRMVKRFLASGRSGFYLAVEQPGEVGAGDAIVPLSAEPHAVTVAAITRLYVAKAYTGVDVEMVQQAVQVDALPDSWKDYFLERLERHPHA